LVKSSVDHGSLDFATSRTDSGECLLWVTEADFTPGGSRISRIAVVSASQQAGGGHETT